MTPEKQSWLPLTEIQATLLAVFLLATADVQFSTKAARTGSSQFQALRKAKLDTITGATLVIFHCTLGIFAKYAFEEDWLFFSNFSAHFNP